FAEASKQVVRGSRFSANAVVDVDRVGVALEPNGQLVAELQERYRQRLAEVENLEAPISRNQSGQHNSVLNFRHSKYVLRRCDADNDGDGSRGVEMNMDVLVASDKPGVRKSFKPRYDVELKLKSDLSES